jgi:TonB-dependent receptor
LINGLYTPNPKDFGMAASADVKTLLLNYGAMKTFAAANYAAVPFAGQACASPLTGTAMECTAGQQADAIATYASYAAAHGGNPMAAEQTGTGYIVTEKVTSAYLNTIRQGDLWSKPYVLTIGLRYAHTEMHSQGYSSLPTTLIYQEEKVNGHQQQSLQAYYDYTNSTNRWLPSVTLETADASYDNFLPDIDFKLNLTDNLIWRAGASQSLTRPALDLLAPVTSVGGLKVGADQSSLYTSNPHLKPVQSTNFDTAGEWYYGTGNAITFDAFWKSIKGLTAYTTTDDVALSSITTGAGYTSFLQTSPINSKAVEVYGATLGWTHSFDMGLGWQVNYTWTGTNWSFNPTTWTPEQITLPGLSNAFNAVLFYEKHGLGVRLAYNWRAKFLAQTNFQSGGEWYQVTNTEPVFAKSFQTVDARVAYAILDNAEVYIEGTNLLAEPVTRVGRFDNLTVGRDNYGSNIVVGYSMKF